MKILIHFHSDLKKEESEALQTVSKLLKKEGHNVTEFKSKGDRSKSAKESEILITDITNSALDSGIEISRSLSENKVLILLQKEKTGLKSEFSKISKEKNVIVKNYKAGTIDKDLQIVIKEASKKVDSKFILIISPEIERYLSWSAKNKRIHKAQLVRNALENMLSKDKDYQNYLKD